LTIIEFILYEEKLVGIYPWRRKMSSFLTQTEESFTLGGYLKHLLKDLRYTLSIASTPYGVQD
jgi:hypothetical protein